MVTKTGVECLQDLSYVTDIEFINDRKIIKNPDKYCLDLYLPKQSDIEQSNNINISVSNIPVTTKTEPLLENNNETTEVQDDQSATPLVIFAHGGAWWSGDRRAWRHASYIDFNPVSGCMSYFWNRIYCNVGNAFAKQGVACAVISYPLAITNLEWPALLAFVLLSFISSTIFFAFFFSLLVLLLWLICLAVKSSLQKAVPLQYISVFLFYDGFNVNSFSSWFALFALYHIIILVFKACHPMNRKPKPHFPTTITIGFACALWLVRSIIFNMTIHRIGAVILIDAFTILLNYMIVVHRLSYWLPKVDVTDQLDAIAKVLSWSERCGKLTGQFDPSKVVLMGYSAGVHLLTTAILRTDVLSEAQRKNIKGVIGISGVYDMDYIASLGLSKHLVLYPGFGKDVNRWHHYSPQHLLDKQRGDLTLSFPPALFFNANREVTEIDIQTTDFMHSLQAKGVTCDHRTVPKLGHFEIINFFGWNYKLKDKSETMEGVCADFVRIKTGTEQPQLVTRQLVTSFSTDTCTDDMGSTTTLEIHLQDNSDCETQSAALVKY